MSHDLSRLPEPVRLALSVALAERKVRQALEAAASQEDTWLGLVAAVTADLDPCLIPFADIHRKPGDWQGWENVRPVRIDLPGLGPMAVSYYRLGSPRCWRREPGWWAAGVKYAAISDALLAAWDAAEKEQP